MNAAFVLVTTAWLAGAAQPAATAEPPTAPEAIPAPAGAAPVIPGPQTPLQAPIAVGPMHAAPHGIPQVGLPTATGAYHGGGTWESHSCEPCCTSHRDGCSRGSWTLMGWFRRRSGSCDSCCDNGCHGHSCGHPVAPHASSHCANGSCCSGGACAPACGTCDCSPKCGKSSGLLGRLGGMFRRKNECCDTCGHEGWQAHGDGGHVVPHAIPGGAVPTAPMSPGAPIAVPAEPIPSVVPQPLPSAPSGIQGARFSWWRSR